MGKQKKKPNLLPTFIVSHTLIENSYIQICCRSFKAPWYHLTSVANTALSHFPRWSILNYRTLASLHVLWVAIGNKSYVSEANFPHVSFLGIGLNSSKLILISLCPYLNFISQHCLPASALSYLWVSNYYPVNVKCISIKLKQKNSNNKNETQNKWH